MEQYGDDLTPGGGHSLGNDIQITDLDVNL